MGDLFVAISTELNKVYWLMIRLLNEFIFILQW